MLRIFSTFLKILNFLKLRFGGCLCCYLPPGYSSSFCETGALAWHWDCLCVSLCETSPLPWCAARGSFYETIIELSLSRGICCHGGINGFFCCCPPELSTACVKPIRDGMTQRLFFYELAWNLNWTVCEHMRMLWWWHRQLMLLPSARIQQQLMRNRCAGIYRLDFVFQSTVSGVSIDSFKRRASAVAWLSEVNRIFVHACIFLSFTGYIVALRLLWKKTKHQSMGYSLRY